MAVPKRNRSGRGALLNMQPGRFARLVECLRRGDVLLRLTLCMLAAATLWGVTAGWKPPFPFRTGQVPRRDVVSRVEFNDKDEDATREMKRQRRSEMPCVYKHDPRRLLEFRQGLKEKLFQIIRAESLDKLPPDVRQQFFPPADPPPPPVTATPSSTPATPATTSASAPAPDTTTSSSTPAPPTTTSASAPVPDTTSPPAATPAVATSDAAPAAEPKSVSDMPPAAPAAAPVAAPAAAPLSGPERAFVELKEAFADDMDLARFETAITRTLADFERDGLLEELEHKPENGSATILLVHSVGDELSRHLVNVNDVRIQQAVGRIEKRLPEELRQAKLLEARVASASATLFAWIKPRLPKTLAINDTATAAERLEIERRIDLNPEIKVYARGTPLAIGNRPITEKSLRLLRLEHEAQVSRTGTFQRLAQSLASFGLYIAMYVLCGAYIYYREPRLLCDLRRFATLLGTVVATVVMCWLTSFDQWRAEIVPMILFGMTVAIAYKQELALLLIACVSLVITLALGHGLSQFVVLAAATAAAVLLTGRIRSRTRLIYVGLMVASVTFLSSLGVSILTGQTNGAPNVFLDPTDSSLGATVWSSPFTLSVLAGAAWTAVCSVLAGLLMTGILPFIEKIFDVQTDISLLELGDAAHPLLQELVRRAPGTYNHSINVASIAEAAAEAIGGNGLLVRVGAYFHDIGKMLKPGYYVENQGQDVNRHLSLLPAMSTLVIIAHVKDGANLARQHGLPQSIIDFIEQHHGTTLVEYFYRQATKQSEADPDASEVDETSFRYPGPKPQSKETGVLMLADAVESASRTLVDPTPSRIENLVSEIAMKRLLDGQFEECGLTLQELHTIEESLVKSLTAVYHGRVKYPDQQTA